MTGPLRILLAGSRDWTDADLIHRCLLDTLAQYTHPGDPVLVHGGCRTGADRIADQMWRALRIAEPMRHLAKPEVHRANWGHYGPRAGPLRNAEMVGQGATVLLAFPLGESRGTRDCIRKAQAAGIPVVIHEGTSK